MHLCLHLSLLPLQPPHQKALLIRSQVLKKQFSISGNRISKLELQWSQSIPVSVKRFENEAQQSLV